MGGITKKLRFEIFKRDSFTCSYCGSKPPAVTLEVDHINPKSKGGKNDINNLTTSCFDCNRGKTNVPLTNIPKKLADNLEAIKEKEAQINEYNKYLKKIHRRENKDISEIDDIYNEQYPEYRLSESFKNGSIKKFLQCLPKQEVIQSLNIAISRLPNDSNNVIKYFCGICWNKIKGE